MIDWTIYVHTNVRDRIIPVLVVALSRFQLSRVCAVLDCHLFMVRICYSSSLGDWELSTF